jgi:membrane protein implicated in regulation of membrane protease activity
MAAERNFSRRQRIVIAALVWVILAPLIVGFLYLSWIFGLILAGVAVWTTWDYVRKGDMAGHVSEGMSKEGLVGKAVEDTYFGGDPFVDR